MFAALDREETGLVDLKAVDLGRLAESSLAGKLPASPGSVAGTPGGGPFATPAQTNNPAAAGADQSAASLWGEPSFASGLGTPPPPPPPPPRRRRRRAFSRCSR